MTIPPPQRIAGIRGMPNTTSVTGGMWSLTLTDIIQFVIKTVGIFLVLLPLSIRCV